MLAHLIIDNFETMTKVFGIDPYIIQSYKTMTKVFGVDPYIINNKFIEIFSARKLGHL